ncbi:MAG: hypothetical protein ACK4E8_03795 [Lacibacter sp.]
MKQLSLWAHKHPVIARTIIILFHIPLNLLALHVGYQLYASMGITLDAWVLNTTALITFVLLVTYKYFKGYVLQRLYHVCMVWCTFCMVAFFGNQYNQSNPYLPFAVNTQAVTYNSSIDPITHKPESKKASVKKQRQQKKQLRNKLRAFIQKEWKAGKGNGWAILGAIAVVLLLVAAIIGAIACSQSCTGSQSLGMLALMAFL